MSIPKKPFVSVCMITYNHQSYIAEAIEGVLMQKTTFPFELVIGEDCSSDRTREICLEYQRKYPDVIRLLMNEQNIGMIPNFVQTLKACQGKYIALCEGDDYWTDPMKLSEQVSFLEENNSFSASSHNVTVIYEDSNRESHSFGKDVPQIIKPDDLVGLRKFHTASVVFRKYIIEDTPLPTNITSGDRALFLLLGCHGDIAYLNKLMAVYRKNNTGISSWVTEKILKKDLNIIKWLNRIDKKVPKKQYVKYIYKTCILYPSEISLTGLVTNYIGYLRTSFVIWPIDFKDIFDFSKKQFYPRLKELIKKRFVK